MKYKESDLTYIPNTIYIDDATRVFQSGMGGFEGIILDEVSYLENEEYGAILRAIAEIVPEVLIKHMDIEDKDDRLYCSDDMFNMVCYSVYHACKIEFPNIAEIALILNNEGY